MEEKEAISQAAHKKEESARDEKWIKHWEERRMHTDGNTDKEIANMDHVDFSLFLQEIEHH